MKNDLIYYTKKDDLLTTEPSFDAKFYDAIKNAHPIAFLASLSMAVAVLSESTESLKSVYDNAILAAIMFLSSFLLSLTDKLGQKTDRDEYFKYGTYFFFAVGIFYLIRIGYDFSKTVPQVVSIFSGWVVLAMGISFLTTVVRKQGKFNPTLYKNNSNFRIIQILGCSSASGFLFSGLVFVGKGFFNLTIDPPISEYLFLPAGVSFALIFVEIFVIEKTLKKQRTST